MPDMDPASFLEFAVGVSMDAVDRYIEMTGECQSNCNLLNVSIQDLSFEESQRFERFSDSTTEALCGAERALISAIYSWDGPKPDRTRPRGFIRQGLIYLVIPHVDKESEEQGRIPRILVFNVDDLIDIDKTYDDAMNAAHPA